MFIYCLLLLCSCNKDKPLFQLLDLNKAGINFENRLNPTEDFNIIDYLYFYNGGGVSIGDINNDHLPDLFFTSNQGENKLYLNRGSLEFLDITNQAGVAGNSSWNTGSVMVDINHDGLLDIYVCAVVGLKNLKGHNELFINNGNNTFSERASSYGLDFESYSSSATFFDYDLDGDLDMYLLNHAVHTPESFGHADLRNTRNYESGDKLLRNDGDTFVDVSEDARIFGGINGYGLGVAVSDFNQDGYPDLYISNDFHEDDYFYLNNGNGTFSEKGKQSFTHFSRFSMGNDAADINHDGYPDLITLDMLPDDETILKRSEGDESINILKLKKREYGYHYQFSRNMLQVNQGNGEFEETALMSQIAATDWSWSALFSDFDQDGNQDLFISNGIPRRPNDLDYIKYVSSDNIVNTMGTTRLADQKALALMPPGIMQNYIYRGLGSYRFEDQTKEWLQPGISCSTATAIGDLDNDGDLDIICNNVDAAPSIYINQINSSASFLKVRFKYNQFNLQGIGTRIYAYKKGLMQFKELYTVRGFQASSEPIIHFGFGDAQEIDSIRIVWPNNKTQKLIDVKVNQTLEISPNNPTKFISEDRKSTQRMFIEIDPSEVGLIFLHKEDAYTDFDRLKLLPYQQSDRGPATAIGDINNDGLEDIFFGGSKRIPAQFFIQTKRRFVKHFIPEILKDSIKEDIDAVIADFNLDGKSDLFIGTGGADFYGKSDALLDSYYSSGPEEFVPSEIENYYENAACVKDFDFDRDGDMDLFVGNESVSNAFGKPPKSYLLVNQNGKLVPGQKDLFETLGMVTDAVWDDYNNDGWIDLIVVGEWMEPLFLMNNKSKFERYKPLRSKLGGLWQSISAFDIDKDGDMDYLLGNWGLNSKFRASEQFPLIMYYHDFDNNGASETVIAIEKMDEYYPIDGLDGLASQIPSIRKRFTNYQSFAGRRVDEIFSHDQLNSATLYNAHTLASGYLKNNGGQYSFVQFPLELQVAPIMAQLKFDFDSDGNEEVLVGGNYFGVQPFHGRYGSFSGSLVKSDKSFLKGNSIGLSFFNCSVRNFRILHFNSKEYLLVTINDGAAQIYEIVKK